jgi:hypothetical protein
MYRGEMRSIHTILDLRLKNLRLLPQITTCTHLEMGILLCRWWTLLAIVGASVELFWSTISKYYP